MHEQHTRTVKLQRTIEGFRTHLMEKGRKPSTIKRYLYDVEDFIDWLHQNNYSTHTTIWSTLQTKDYENFFFDLKENRHYSTKTMHRIFIVLNRLYTYLQHENPHLINPLVDVDFISQPNRALRDEDFITPEEERALKRIVASLDGLSEKQLPARSRLIDRNICIIMLLLDYGLSLQELVSLEMQHVHFENNTLTIPPASGVSRTLTLMEEDKKQLYKYYQAIPAAVRPQYHSTDPFFVAFDFNRNTYRWVYENDAPKSLMEISIQKMIRQEVARAGLRKGISGQHFRNTFILHLIEQDVDEDTISKRIGFKSKQSLKRYYDYVTKKRRTSEEKGAAK